MKKPYRKHLIYLSREDDDNTVWCCNNNIITIFSRQQILVRMFGIVWEYVFKKTSGRTKEWRDEWIQEKSGETVDSRATTSVFSTTALPMPQSVFAWLRYTTWRTIAHTIDNTRSVCVYSQSQISRTTTVLTRYSLPNFVIHTRAQQIIKHKITMDDVSRHGTNGSEIRTCWNREGLDWLCWPLSFCSVPLMKTWM